MTVWPVRGSEMPLNAVHAVHLNCVVMVCVCKLYI